MYVPSYDSYRRDRSMARRDACGRSEYDMDVYVGRLLDQAETQARAGGFTKRESFERSVLAPIRNADSLIGKAHGFSALNDDVQRAKRLYRERVPVIADALAVAMEASCLDLKIPDGLLKAWDLPERIGW